MGNCCTTASSTHRDGKKITKTKPNPFSIDYGKFRHGNGWQKLVVLKEPTGRDIGDKYELGRELGRGEFGVTCVCTNKVTGNTLACKSIQKKELKMAIDIVDVRREVAIMRHLPEHPNITTLKETFEDDNAVHLVMELCEGGELFDRIIAKGRYTERAAVVVIKTIVDVVEVCHKHGVIHRDLKPENFLFANKKEAAPLKAIDFGLSVFFEPGERFNEIVGSPHYMAPEVLKRNYEPEIDIWSVGVILYILLCGFPPFWAETEQGVAQAILQSVVDFKRDPWPKVSKDAKDLIRRMLEPDPKRRLTAQQVLDHLWLENAKRAPNVSLGETVRARLEQFLVMNKLKKRALRVIAENLSVEEASSIHEIFQSIDITNRGKVTSNELRTGLHKLGHHINDYDLQILLEAADADRDKYLDCKDFVTVSVHIKNIGEEDHHLQKAFKFFDKNQNGYLEIKELRAALIDEAGTSEETIKAIIREVDTNRDARISYEEFSTMMRAGTDWRKVSRRYSRKRFDNLSMELMRNRSLDSNNDPR